MKIQYLGTAAAEGIPAIFCSCETCRKSREQGGRNIRTRSQALLDDRLLIDFPADTYMHFLTYSIPMRNIKNCLITHSHADHLYAEELAMRKQPFSHICDDDPMVFYADEAAFRIILQAKINNDITDKTVMVKQIKLYEPFAVDNYQVIALRAAHDIKSSPVVYLIERNGKTLFYSNDTSEYPTESMEYLKSIKKPIDLISLDCTEACNHTTYKGHLSLERCVNLRKSLMECGAANNDTIFVLNHFSHNGAHVLYDDFEKIAKQHQFQLSYDGMVIEF